MKIFLLKNNRQNRKNNCTELFGLSRSGKSSLLKKIEEKKEKKIFNSKLSIFEKLFYLMKFFVKNPVKTIMLFSKMNSNWLYLKEFNFLKYAKIFLMRNSYLGYVLAKHEIIGMKNIYVDEFLMQSLFMLIQRKSNEIELSDLIKVLPSGRILLVEENEKERYKRIDKTRYPAEQIDKAYAVKWMENMEFNYKIIRKILFENYTPVLIKNLKQL